jgi:hypothetical protein
MRLRFYAQGAPSWWPYQLVSLANRRLPPKRMWFYEFLVDNGMFAYWKTGQRPDVGAWLEKLARLVHEIDKRYKPVDITVILPDWLGDPSFTLKAAGHRLSKLLCRDYDCLVVAHSSPTLLRWIPDGGEYYGGYARSALEAAAIPWVVGLAAPLKLPCSRAARGRRVIKPECQAEITRQVCSVARRHGLACHGLGVLLRPDHIKRLVDYGLTSFDSSSWTRPNSSEVERVLGGRWSAKNSREKDLFMKVVLQRLSQAIDLEGVELAKVR